MGGCSKPPVTAWSAGRSDQPVTRVRHRRIVGPYRSDDGEPPFRCDRFTLRCEPILGVAAVFAPALQVQRVCPGGDSLTWIAGVRLSARIPEWARSLGASGFWAIPAGGRGSAWPEFRAACRFFFAIVAFQLSNATCHGRGCRRA